MYNHKRRTRPKCNQQRSSSLPLPSFFSVSLFPSPPKTPFSAMGRTTPRWPIFFLNRVVARVRFRPPPVEPKRISNVDKNDRTAGFSNGEKHCSNGGKPLGRRIMIVVDSSAEAKAALQWALTHTVQNNDTMILLSVIKPCKQGDALL